MILWYDKDGLPLTQERAARLFENMEYRRVADDVLAGGRWVSTVWMGLYHGADDEGRPLIFETMVFTASPNTPGWAPGDVLDCERASTKDGALAAHERMVAKYGGRIQ